MSATVVVMLHSCGRVIHDRIDQITIKNYHSGHICMFLRPITAMLIGHTWSDVHRSQQTRRSINVGLTLVHRLRRWTNV